MRLSAALGAGLAAHEVGAENGVGNLRDGLGYFGDGITEAEGAGGELERSRAHGEIGAIHHRRRSRRNLG